MLFKEIKGDFYTFINTLIASHILWMSLDIITVNLYTLIALVIYIFAIQWESGSSGIGIRLLDFKKSNEYETQ